MDRGKIILYIIHSSLEVVDTFSRFCQDLVVQFIFIYFFLFEFFCIVLSFFIFMGIKNHREKNNAKTEHYNN